MVECDRQVTLRQQEFTPWKINRERLAEDHRKAKEISVVLNSLPYIKKVEPTETNIVIFEIDEKQMYH